MAKNPPGGLNLGSAPAPPAKKSQGGIGGELVSMLKQKAPGLQKYAPLILKWASVYNVDPLYLGAVLSIEDPSGNPDARSSAGASGLAQILDKSINPNTNPNAVWDGPAVLTDEWKQVPDHALKYLAWRIAGEVNQYGTLDAAYSKGYNPGYTGKQPSSFLPKGYVPTSGPGTQPTSAEGAGPSVAGTQARHAITDPWVVVGKNGGVKYVASQEAPRSVLRDGSGDPVTRSTFNAYKSKLDSLYMAWTTEAAPTKAVASYIKNPVSDYEIQARLSNPKVNPRIYKSAVWETHAPDYEAVYKQVYGNDAKPPLGLILEGVVRNLSQTGFMNELRSRPDYTKSEEFKANAASFRTGYESIYGTPDQIGEQKIEEAVRKGLSQDQWMQALRADPAYKQSGEFQQNVYSLFSRMGFVPSGQTLLQAPAPAAPTPAPSATATGSGVTS